MTENTITRHPEKSTMQPHAPDRPLATRSISSRLTPEARRARQRILAHTLALGRPFNVGQDHGLASDREIEELLARKAMVIDDQGNVPFIYPVSALPTHHRVTLADGRAFSAMCAIDAMGAAFTFGQDTQIHSKCSVCNQPVHLALRQGRIAQATPADVHVLHMDLNQLTDWAASC
jgi:hypothetical protein